MLIKFNENIQIFGNIIKCDVAHWKQITIQCSNKKGPHTFNHWIIIVALFIAVSAWMASFLENNNKNRKTLGHRFGDFYGL